MRRCEIGELADRPAGDLSTGQRRLVELARAIASSFEVLLLDEPSSGLDPIETERVGAVLLDLVADGNVAVLLVEHDMALVRQTCDDLFVLDFGRLIAQGPAAEVLATSEVRDAYLGTSESAA